MSKWVFRKELYEKNPKNQTNLQHWAEKIDGDEIEFRGENPTSHKGYEIHRDWCEEIKEVAMKTRMHEILGVEPGEVFAVEGYKGEFYLDDYGHLVGFKGAYGTPSGVLVVAVNFGIIRKPRLTAEQLYALEALYRVFGAEWLCKDKDAFPATMYNEKPKKSPRTNEFIWMSGCELRQELYYEKAKLRDLVSWADTEPLDILKTLRDNGVDA